MPDVNATPAPSDWSGFEVVGGRRTRSGAWTNRGYGAPVVRRKPQSEAQALMEAAPFEEPREVEGENDDEDNILSVELFTAIARLNEHQAYLLDAYISRGLSFQEIADEGKYSKSHVHRLYHEAVAALKVELLQLKSTQSARLAELLDLEVTDDGTDDVG